MFVSSGIFRGPSELITRVACRDAMIEDRVLPSSHRLSWARIRLTLRAELFLAAVPILITDVIFSFSLLTFIAVHTSVGLRAISSLWFVRHFLTPASLPAFIRRPSLSDRLVLSFWLSIPFLCVLRNQLSPRPRGYSRSRATALLTTKWRRRLSPPKSAQRSASIRECAAVLPRQTNLRLQQALHCVRAA
jgi:hypothetical protein